MYRAAIAIVDASRARIFTFDRDSDAGGTHEELVEKSDLVNPARRRRPSELFSESRPGSSRAGGLQFAFDDHRSANVAAMDHQFARDVMIEVARVLEAADAHRVIVCASPHMLGELRAAELAQAGYVVDELPRDLAKLAAPQLRDRLASYGLLPPRPARPTAAS